MGAGGQPARDEMIARITRLEREFDRLTQQVSEVVVFRREKEFEVRAGLRVVCELVEECRPIGMSIRAALEVDSNDAAFAQAVADLHHVENMYDFILFCNDKATRLGWPIPTQNDDPEPDIEKQSRLSPGRIQPENFFRSDEVGVGRLYGRHTNAPPVTVVSSSSSHQQNLTTLIAIAFFGASITWSTIFSGSRGNIVLIAWSACLFIVSAVAASAATLLVVGGGGGGEEDLVAKYRPVRWTVRILSLIAMLHILGGMLFVSLAILLLDLDQDQDAYSAQLEGSTRRVWFRVAGGYAMGASGVILGVAAAVWRRYTVRTWFVHPTALGRAYNRQRGRKRKD